MPKELKRHLSWLDAASIVVGIVIGAGIFVTPQGLARQVPSANAMMFAWVVSGFLVFCGALAFAELSAMLPATGGVYVYLREAFGPAVAFSSGWVHLFALFSGATAFVASGFVPYLSALIPVDPSMAVPITIVLIIAVSAIGAISTKAAVELQNITNFAKITALLALIGLAFFAPRVAALHRSIFRSAPLLPLSPPASFVMRAGVMPASLRVRCAIPRVTWRVLSRSAFWLWSHSTLLSTWLI